MKVPFQFMLLPIILANSFSVPFQAQPLSFAGPMGYLLGGQESSPDISVPTYYPPSGDPSLYLDDIILNFTSHLMGPRVTQTSQYELLKPQNDDEPDEPVFTLYVEPEPGFEFHQTCDTAEKQLKIKNAWLQAKSLARGAHASLDRLSTEFEAFKTSNTVKQPISK